MTNKRTFKDSNDMFNGLGITYDSREFLDGYTEGPFSHDRWTTESERENEYFMQYVHQWKLHMIALRTAVGNRITYGLAEDVWNNKLGIISDYVDTTKEINDKLIDYLHSRNWFLAMEKLTAFKKEQGEAILLLYTEDTMQKGFDAWDQPVDENSEILKYEAVNKVNYRIVEWDDFGEPKNYQIMIKGPTGTTSYGPATRSIRVDGSRVIRDISKDIYQRGFGYPDLAVSYDSIVILSNIIKGTGEAAFRWGTGHPLILTKDIRDETQLNKLKRAIGTPTRRSWHILPSEYIDRFDLVGQAGQMLNFKALADIVIDQIIIATKIPRPILLGEVAGVVQGSEVNERSYFAVLDEIHDNLEGVVRHCFSRDVNIRKLLKPLNGKWELSWGIREVLNKVDQAKLDQMYISNTLALTSIITVNEARDRMGMQPLPLEDLRGEMILGVGLPITEADLIAAEASQSDETNTASEKSKSTDKQEKNPKDLNKDKTTQNPKNKLRENKSKVADSLKMLRDSYSVNEICDMFSIGKQTFYKLLKKAEENEV